ncbi:MAG TPA: uracil-DNA glycosylase [bacterium]
MAVEPVNYQAIVGATDYPTFARLLRDSGCRRCALAANRTRIVVDRGDHRAGILAIGEAPGRQEDLAGRAFVGRAGRLLDELLREARIDPDADVLITNLVKCRPPANRVPRPDEVAACRPYLERQLRLVRPHTVLLLGATALRHFRPSAGVALGESAGRRFALEAWPGVAFWPLYHPAYLLRSRRKRPLALEHLERIRRKIPLPSPVPEGGTGRGGAPVARG